MKLRVGKTYLTRNGMKAIVRSHHPDKMHLPFYVTLSEPGFHFGFFASEDGKYFVSPRLHMHDLVKEIRTVKNIIVIYHANCADGVAAAWALKYWFGSTNPDMEFHAGVYGAPIPDVGDKLVILADFSYKKDIILQMLDVAAEVVLLDHHKSSLEDLKDIDDPHFNMDWSTNEKSGCRIAWDYGRHHNHSNKELPELLQHIEDRDLWQFKLKNTDLVTAGLFTYPITMETIDFYSNDSYCDLLISEGKVALRKHKQEVEQVVKKNVREMLIGNWLVPTANASFTLASDVGNVLSHDAPFAATYYDTAEYRIFSLRSQKVGGVDVSSIALQYGGGGHANAAGFKVSRDHELAKA